MQKSRLTIGRAFCAVTLGLTCLSATLAHANLVVNGDFEVPDIQGTFTTYNTGASIGAWKVASGSVDLINSYWQPASGGQSLDTAGNISGMIRQDIATTPGATYHLTFDMSGNPDGQPTIKTLLVSFGAASQTFTFDTTGIAKADMHWALKSWDIVATGTSTVLSFQDFDNPPTAYGPALDNVSLVAVPEPTTMIAGALLLLPFGASTLRMLRKKA